MKKENHGIKIFDEKGSPILEIGPHIIRESPLFSEKIGIIAAAWAQAEVNLNCLFAVLLDTTPDEAARRIKRYGTAARATDGARKLSEDTLQGEELKSLSETLDRLDAVRLRRNRVQHDVWAKKSNDEKTLFAVHSDLYLSFVTGLVETLKSGSPEDKASDRAIELANEFAASVSNGYSIVDLEDIGRELDGVGQALLKAMFSRLMQQRSHS